MEMKNIVCTNVKRLRLEKGYSVRKFASLVGVDEKQIRRVESGEYKCMPRISTLEKIVKALGIPIETLFQSEITATSQSVYFVTLLVKGPFEAPSKIALYDGDTTFEQALKTLIKTKDLHTTYSAWIDLYDANGKSTVFHQCYI